MVGAGSEKNVADSFRHGGSLYIGRCRRRICTDDIGNLWSLQETMMVLRLPLSSTRPGANCSAVVSALVLTLYGVTATVNLKPVG
ncbi:hypothetical protein DENSPDRAFT_342789 [Dentipellis sp. KUC8613]|nr:hypothetical protein DENSPDRAFT_342789 [Dentipellis sp. KUC8613]